MTVQGPIKEQQPDGMSHRGFWSEAIKKVVYLRLPPFSSSFHRFHCFPQETLSSGDSFSVGGSAKILGTAPAPPPPPLRYHCGPLQKGLATREQTHINAMSTAFLTGSENQPTNRGHSGRVSGTRAPELFHSVWPCSRQGTALRSGAGWATVKKSKETSGTCGSRTGIPPSPLKPHDPPSPPFWLRTRARTHTHTHTCTPLQQQSGSRCYLARLPFHALLRGLFRS